MRIKKIALIFLTAALLISTLPIIGSAETTETFKVGVEAMTAASTVSASPVIYNQGDTFSIEIRASQNTGVSALKLVVDYDETVLTPVTSDACGLLQSSDTLTHYVTDGDGYFIFYTLSTTEVFDAAGILARITFAAKDTCVDNTAVTVRLFGDNGSCGKFTLAGFVPVPLVSESQSFAIHKIDKSTGVVTLPTCTVDGWTTYPCSACEQPVIGNVVPMKGHDLAEAVEENRVEASCTEAGSYDSVVYCKTAGCGAELSRTTHVLNATGHDPAEPVEENYVAPTIIQTGSYDSVVYCKTCNTELSRQPVAVPRVIPADGWHLEGGNWYCFEEGQMVKNAWRKDSVGWCYLDAEGSMATNKWVKDSVGWCYVGEDGYCVTNTWKRDSIGWCYLDSEGRMTTNKWVKDSVGWCYVGEDGYCVTNAWKKDSTGWCYLNAEGRLVVSDWVFDGGSWYYLDAEGYMLYSTSRNINGKIYRFNASGICTNP